MTNTKILRAALLATSSLVAGGVAPAMAGGPWGEQVIVGEATITRPNAKETLITQSSSKALIDWTGFSIPSGSLVDFKQPGSTSLTVNRVTGPDASEIDGELLANGAIWLLNSNGILFGRGSQVNVGALLATTSDISDDNVESGHYAFSHATNPNASVVNLGTIKTKSGGSVVLSAPEVANRGLIQANLGTVQLGGASAFSVDMDGDNLIRYQITTPVTSAPKGADGKTAAALVSNSGTIVSTGGKVLMTASAVKSVQDDVINNTGIVEATSVASHDGEIDLDAGPNGTVDAGGTLNVSGTSAGETGGTVAMTGNTVRVENRATINASGADGGGTVLIGGGFHGKGPIANAETTLVGKATINVSATGKGNGGKVAVWSDKRTVFAGRINAKGGAQGGNGGYIETSSEHSLQIAQDVLVNASAPHGSKGTWLLDPLNIIIETGGTTQLNNGILGLNVDPGKTDTIDPNTITAALNSTNVLLEAANDITVLNDVIYSSLNSLLLLAEHDIYAYANVQNTMASGGGGVYFIAGWDGKTTTISQLTNQGVYGNNDGSIFIGTTNAPGNVAVGSASGTTVAAGDDVTVEADNGYAQIGYAGDGRGNIDVLATGNIDVSDLYALSISASPYAQIGNGGAAVSGNIGGNIDVQAGGSISVTDNNSDSDDPGGFALIGNIGGANSSESGNITLDSTGALAITAEGLSSIAEIGNFATAQSSGNVSGNIAMQTGALSIISDSTSFSDAWIGNGGLANSSGTVSGDIGIVANGDIDILADAAGTGDQARIADRGQGDVKGNIDLSATGNIDISAADANLASVGNGALGTGTTSGDIDVSAGGSLTISATGGGEARISAAGAGDTNIDVTAAGDILIEDSNDSSVCSTTCGPGAWIGNFANGVNPAGGNINVTSTHGSIELDASDSDGSGANAWIGNTSGSTTTSGTITLSAANGVTLDSLDSTAFDFVGNNDQGYTGATSGDITVTTGGALDIEGTNSLIGNEGTTGDISGSVTLTADLVQGFTPSFLNDIPNGNFTIDNRGTGNNFDDTAIYYSSPYTFSYTTGGELIIEASFQNSGTGAINVKAGEDIEIGGPDAAGDVSVGSHGGTTTITAADLIVEADNGLAQLGYDGAGGGDINVNVSGDVVVDALNYPFALIGNGGPDVSGSIGGNITVNAGGSVTVDSEFSDFVNFNEDLAAIGNTGGANASESGNISIAAPGGTNVVASGLIALAYIGNLSYGGNSGGNGSSTGNITISTGDLTLVSDSAGGDDWAIIGDGQFDTNARNGGDIDINAANLYVIAEQSNGGFSQARIANRSDGDVFGNINITTSGDIVLDAGAGSLNASTLAAIGLGEGNAGSTSGNITIDAGGSISLFSSEYSDSRIADGGSSDSNISITAAGQVTMNAIGDDANVSIGNFANAASGGGNISVTSTDGSVVLYAKGSDAFVTIGNSANTQKSATISGNIFVNAHDAVILSATGNGTVVRIGNEQVASQAVSGDISIIAGNTLDLEGGNQVLIGNNLTGDTSGSVTLTAQFFDNINSTILADLQYGNFTIDDLNKNAFVSHSAFAYSSPYTLTGIFAGNVTFLGSILNSGSGGINIVSAGTVTIGGGGASGGVAIGSRFGTTVVDAANLLLDAVNGYAQLGFDGNGSGAIDVTTTGGVTLDGGAGTGDFAQIGDGGYLSNGSNNDDITIDAGGNVTLAGGSGQFAYAQIGNGGAEADQNSSGYTNTGLITVSGENVILDAGSGNAAYAQIGNGGYELGKGLTGQGTNSGDITITAVDSVTLNGNGTDAYAQIGNGGDLVNFNAAAGAGGGDIGDITVTVEANGGSVALTAGNGNDSYVQIGDGGYGENTPNGNPSNFLTGGDIVINALALALTGSNNGENAYAQIGNGDAAQSGDANVEGNITVEGFPTTTSGTASGGEALLGNATGTGTVVGTTGGGGTTTTETVTTIVALTQDATSESADTMTTFYSPIISETPELDTETLTELAPEPQGPLAEMASSSSNGDSSYEGSEPSDELVGSLGQSLDPGRGHKRNAYASVRTLIPGVLKQIESSTSRSPRGVPPADEDYSSWGNKELWR